MLLIPFVENAFKHGRKDVSSPGVIINLESLAGYIKFDVSNPVSKQKGQNKDASPGIGLANVKRRLELIYPGKHELLIKTENDYFNIHLIITE